MCVCTIRGASSRFLPVPGEVAQTSPEVGGGGGIQDRTAYPLSSPLDTQSLKLSNFFLEEQVILSPLPHNFHWITMQISLGATETGHSMVPADK